MDKVLITGATGHLGANLVRDRVAAGDTVRVLLRPGSDEAAVAGLAIERAYADLRDPAAVRAAVRGCRRVYHCAAKISTVSGGEREIHEVNVLGTRNVLEAARAEDVERVVVTGSFGAVGDVPGAPCDESTPFYPFEAHTAYAHTKVLVELETLRAFAAGLDTILAISCGILGPHDFMPSRMGKLMCDFAHGRLPGYLPGGFEAVASRDIVAGHVLAMETGRPGDRYLFSSEYLSMDQLMALLEQLTGARRPRLRLPPRLVTGISRFSSPVLARLSPERQQLFTPAAVRVLTLSRRADCTKARTELGFRPTSVADAVREAYDDFVRRGLIQPRGRTASREVPYGTP
ncbi:NAD-dependent epimerase/dehydratase family protein [Streptomyces sp. NPDC098781]|uniref:NAD-dependent epimerase/dehydratase family protein n=1 Tax=Streptomyces sp. NPDC098781 TaxID=3366097 RepID=UPI00380DA463